MAKTGDIYNKICLGNSNYASKYLPILMHQHRTIYINQIEIMYKGFTIQGKQL